MSLLDGLNPQQQQAVTAGTGPVLVLAGPGSGKTRVLTHRIAHLIKARGVSPYHLLAVTFTNKAAHEMERRVVELLGSQASNGLTLGTFHATCARLLRREAEHLPFESDFVIFDSDDQLRLMKQIIQELNLDPKNYQPQSILASISNAKNELLLAEDYPVHHYRDEVVKRVYSHYQQSLLANNALDFDDLLLWTALLLEGYPQVREKYARRFEHVLVDEFQDTNLAQYRLLRYLSSFHNNIFVVGDTDQSIYTWRGADYRNVIRFERDYPDTQIILLEENYRSTQTILDVAMAVIARNPYRSPKKLHTSRGRGEKIILREVDNEREEAAFVVETIAELIAGGQARPGDIAVMYRTNAQSRLLEEAFLYANLPYRLVGAQRFYGRREVKDVIAYLRLVHNLDDQVSLQRVINLPPRGIGEKSLLTLRLQAKRYTTSPGRLLIRLAQQNMPSTNEHFSARALQSLANFGSMLGNWIAWQERSTALEMIDRILEDTGLRQFIDDGTDEGKDRWENVIELRRLASEFREPGLADFLDQVALVSDQDTMDESKDVPTLLTLHAAKGLEFPVVFIVGLTDGILPHQRSFEDEEAMQEERRLFYVGITRARDRLYLVTSLNRSVSGFSEPVDESRFLADIPSVLILNKRGDRRQERWGDQNHLRWESRDRTLKAQLQPKYSPGMTVLHPVWGEGLVLNSRLQDDDEIVDVFFSGVGLKRLAASLARLELK